MGTRPAYAALFAMALVVIVLTAALTPFCTMPNCDDTSVGACSDFKPACDKCPERVVMKHSHDEASQVSALTLDHALPATALVASAQPELVSQALVAPAPTASPPPLDPLGVRLTI